VVGKYGLGKSWLACALAHKACRDGFTVHYARVPRLFAELELAHGDGSFARLFRTLTRTNLLILDDLGPDRLNASQRRDLMEIVEDRYGRGSTLITSQLPVKAWHDIIAQPTFADAILDRIVHNAYRLELEGESMRPNATKAKPEPALETTIAPTAKPAKNMSVALDFLPAPVGQQDPPTRAAASDSRWSLRAAPGPLLLTTGTASRLN
jgi:hypothetical protein